MKKTILCTVLFFFFNCAFSSSLINQHVAIKPGRNLYITVKYLDPVSDKQDLMSLSFTGTVTNASGKTVPLSLLGPSTWGVDSSNPTISSFWKFYAKNAPFIVDNAQLTVQTFNGTPINLKCPSKSLKSVVHGVVLFSISPKNKTCMVSFYQP
jgi:hypothetical protein